jgi:hypothetical protein
MSMGGLTLIYSAKYSRAYSAMSGTTRATEQKTSVAVRKRTQKRLVDARIAPGEVMDSVINRAVDAMYVVQRLELKAPDLVASAKVETRPA